MISFEAGLSNRQLTSLTSSIEKLFGSAIRHIFQGSLLKVPAIQKLLSWMDTDDFASDIGTPRENALEMKKTLQEYFTNQSVEISVTPRATLVKLLQEDLIRELTQVEWDFVNLKGDKGRGEIIVNAWDIYEYGIVGSKNSHGTIKGHRQVPAKTRAQKIISRSGLSIMRKGGNFTFFKPGAPKINAIRRGLNKFIENSQSELIRNIKKNFISI